ncbi:MAG: 1-acyl-sn-glycerol-3-phosphate acyltransferase [Hyphomicrobiales bacterium]|nr:1-acyl-sn-glycerol-3-phosphate acyltransferase [Hyphomicrobiales bacterium]
MFILALAHTITAVRGNWRGVGPVKRQRVYFVNHNSHGDFVLVWTVLPANLRANTRPVAGSDYWMASRLKRFIGQSVFNAVLIDRNPETRQADPVEMMVEALDAGDSLILFPEGTRNMTEKVLLPFKPGLFHLASARPDIDMVPVWIENLNRVMPKGALVPIPLICTVTFGDAMRLEVDETKQDFLERAEAALLDLSSDKSNSMD